MFQRLFNSKFVKLLFFLMDDFNKTDFSGICSQMSYYFLMAFFPLMIFLISFVGKFVNQFESYLYEVLKEFLPDLSYTYVTSLLKQLTDQSSISSPLLVILCFFFASLAARAIMIGLNQTYGEKETRSIFKLWLFSFIFTLLFAISLLFTAATYLFSTDIGHYLYRFLGLTQNLYPMINLGTQIFSWIVSVFLFSMVYVLAPGKSLPFNEGLPGAVFSTLGLNIAFRIFTFFINHSSKYSTLYGNLGGLFALLVGIYFICVILNLGGKLNIYWSFYKKKQNNL